jgi:hypothetical protein
MQRDCLAGLAYTGWLRERWGGAWHPWRPVVRASTWATCWAGLLAVEQTALACERIVLPASRHPERRARPR